MHARRDVRRLAEHFARLGADWVGPSLLKRVKEGLGWPDPGGLYPLHEARRALLRARLALSHLLDAEPRQPGRWEPLATQYLGLAEEALDRLDAS